MLADQAFAPYTRAPKIPLSFLEAPVMGKPFIVLGDRTNHGGEVLEGDPSTTINGKPVARVGDKVSCPIPGHGTNSIVEGAADTLISDKPVALHGHKTACGATLISSQMLVSWQAGSAGSGANPGSAPAAMAEKHDEQFQLRGADGKPLANAKYLILSSGGQIIEGTTDANGYTQRVKTPAAEQLEIYLVP
jgi:uncharacterized Zn-binding protein involved in type VI secretion